MYIISCDLVPTMILPICIIYDQYSVEDTLKIMSVRYALFCNSPKHLKITIASKVSDATVTAIMESNADLKGVKIQQQTSHDYEETTPTP